MSTEIVEEKIPLKTWLSLIIYIVLMTAFIQTLTLFLPQPFASGLNPGPSGGVYMYMVLPYVVSLLLTIPISLGWLKLDKKTMALLYISTMISVWYSVYKGMFNATFDWMYNVRVSTAAVRGYALPYFWMPSEAAVRASFYHGALGNLFVTYASEWIPVIITWIFYFATVALYTLGWAAILRRLWVDVEVLPFPHAQGWLIAENALQPTLTRPKKLMLIAAAIGILIWVPYYIKALYPAFPDLYGWLTGQYWIGSAFGTFTASSAFPVLQQIFPVPIQIAGTPFRYSIMLLVPLDTLLSMFVSTLLMLFLIPYVLYYMGYYPTLFTIGVDKSGLLFTSPPYHLLTILNGYALGLFVFMILVNWKYFVETIKLAISDKPPKGEVSYRMGYALMIIGAIGWLILFIISNVPPWLAILGLLIVTYQAIIMIRMRAYSGALARIQGVFYFKPFLGDTVQPAPNVPAGQLFMVSHTCRWGIGMDTWAPYLSTLGGALDSFKVASMAEVHPKTVLKLMVIGAIIATVVTTLVMLIEIHAWGFMELPVTKEWDFMSDGDAGYYNARMSIVSLQGLIGFILAAFIIFMRIRFAWWPIEPVGFAVGIGWWPYLSYVGTFTALIAWIIKYAVLKVGGRKVWDEVAMPIILGDIAGEMTGVVLTGILTIVRFIFFKV